MQNRQTNLNSPANSTRLYWLAAVLDVGVIKAGWLTDFGDDEIKFHAINNLVLCPC